ncbi:Tim44 domain-containing protein [Azonexus fungiphilus]|uniref:Tim44 domain-containing protein n=1 Tax=Azonexus fungiphilus TaxID=146940 RepID=UPI00156B5DBB|nr:TIM44-like domain-containing protein [Azonexus fungiphilus]NHC08513.1 Tim44 domain-containing protein [Azonexus fungiphilus]
MNKFIALAAAVVLGFTLNITDAEAAKRLGGGGSTGMQRQATPPSNNVSQTQRQQPATAPQAQPKRSWMGPIAGLAAGLGLAALASHLGFGEGLANFMMIALLAIVVIAAVGFFLRKKAGAQAQGMQYAGAGANYGGQPANVARPDFTPAGGAFTPAAQPTAATGGNIPADFDAEGFVRNAKVNFIRLQAANDAGNLDDIREFTSPEMFAEIKMAIAERNGAPQETDVVRLDAQVIDVAEEGGRYIVSVHFSGEIREERNAPAENFSEVWHMSKPIDGSRGWVIAGIQQVQ